MQNSDTSVDVTVCDEQILNVALIYDIECYAAITHKYNLPHIGVFKDDQGKFACAISQSDLLYIALDDYYQPDGSFTIPLIGFVDHLDECRLDLARAQSEFGLFEARA